MIDHGVIFDAPIITQGFPMGDIGMQVNNYPSFPGEMLRVNSEPMSIGAQYVHPPDMASAVPFNGPLSAPLIGHPSAGTKFNGNAHSVDERTRTSTGVADDPEKSSSLVRVSAERWASRNGFTSDQMTEFGHLMGMVCSTYIAKNKLTSLKEIDKGSFGKIYSTTYDGVPVAVKQISNKPGDSTIKSKMRELLLELRVLVRVRHPNVVTFWGTATEFPSAESTQTQPYIGLVFELCERGSLHNALFDAQTKLKASQKLKIAHQCSLGLMYLHSKRVIHRDINPRNILLTSDYSAKIADFGCARVLSGSASSLKTTTISGSPAYMAPEQLLGQELTEAVDTWAFSAMMWEIMMDQKPWEGRFTDFNLLKNAILKGEKLHLPHDSRPYPACYVNMIKLGMAYKPQDRPAMSYIEGEIGSAIAQFQSNLKREQQQQQQQAYY